MHSKSNRAHSAPIQTVATVPVLWSQQELAQYLGKSVKWCERSRLDGTGPRFMKVGRHVRYRVEDVMQWAEDHSFQSTSQASAAVA